MAEQSEKIQKYECAYCLFLVKVIVPGTAICPKCAQHFNIWPRPAVIKDMRVLKAKRH